MPIISDGYSSAPTLYFEEVESNPYLKEFLEKQGYNYISNMIKILDDDPYTPREIIKSMDRLRFKLIGKYSFAVPCREALQVIAKYEPLIEIGAGLGYWTFLLEQTNVDIIAVDNITIKDEKWKHIFGDNKAFANIIDGDESTITLHPQRNLFLCWPPYNNPMAFRCLKNFKGEYVVYIGEGYGGCTGDNDFHRALEGHFDLIENVCIPQWQHIHDGLYVYRRRI